MPTIKTKKEMNLPELIEWGWKNEIKKRSFISNDDKVTANFEDMGRFIADNFISSDVTFTVEVEEEITEDTVLPKLVTRNTSGRYNGWTSDCVKGFNLKFIEAIYILNDDKTMTLIWTKEKGLVE